MSYYKYPKEMKESIVARMLPGKENMAGMNHETGSNINTLYHW